MKMIAMASLPMAKIHNSFLFQKFIFENLIMPAIPHHLRSMTELPNEGRMVRLHIGLEDKNDLCADLAQAFTKLEKKGD